MYDKSLFLTYIFDIWYEIKFSGSGVRLRLIFWANYSYKLYLYMLYLKSSIQNGQEAQSWQTTVIEELNSNFNCCTAYTFKIVFYQKKNYMNQSRIDWAMNLWSLFVFIIDCPVSYSKSGHGSIYRSIFGRNPRYSTNLARL